jgi:hypothetical protein
MRARNKDWMRHVFDLAWRTGLGECLHEAAFAERYEIKSTPILKLRRVKGQLMLVSSRNEVMKMLLQKHESTCDSPLNVSPRPIRRAALVS